MGQFNFNFQPRPEEVRSASAVIFKEVFDENKWDGYDLRTGVTHGQQVLITDGLGVTGTALPNGQCAPADVGDVSVSEKTINPVLTAARFKYCAARQNQLVKILKAAQNTFVDFFKRNPSDSEMTIIAGLVMQSMKVSTEAKAWFSDINADTIANGGAFKDANEIPKFNQFNGFFKQIFGSSDVKHIEITENNGADYAAQTLTPEKAYEYVKAVRLAAPVALTMREGQEIKVTRAIYDKLLVYLGEKGLDGGGLTQIIENGKATLSFLGVPVRPMPKWDYVINKYQNSGSKWILPNRIVYTWADNLVIGTINKDDLSNFRYIFDEVGLQNILDWGYTLDAVIPIEAEVVAAY